MTLTSSRSARPTLGSTSPVTLLRWLRKFPLSIGWSTHGCDGQRSTHSCGGACAASLNKSTTSLSLPIVKSSASRSPIWIRPRLGVPRLRRQISRANSLLQHPQSAKAALPGIVADRRPTQFLHAFKELTEAHEALRRMVEPGCVPSEALTFGPTSA